MSAASGPGGPAEASEAAGAAEASEVHVRLDGVGRTYRRGRLELTVLRDVGLRVARGEFVAITGASGSGKSTLLQLVGGLDAPTAGVVRVGGRRLDALDEPALARYRLREVGTVFQSFHLMPALSAVENAALPLLLADAPRRRALAEAEALLGRLGLAERLHHMPEELSGGEMQRVAMARAMIGRPALLLADEPTGNLDPYAGEEVMRLLRRVPRERGQTVLMATHDARAAAYADRVVLLENGTLREAAGA